MALLSVTDLHKSYLITKTVQQPVLKGVTIEFRSGDLVALLGESGCGKSTLINILGGLDRDYYGEVRLQNRVLGDFTERELDDYRKKDVGLIFQNYNLIPNMNIRENVEIAMTIADAPADVRRARALELLKLVGLDQSADKMPDQLSGGQRQRVAIARALVTNPTVLLADEPTGALDRDSADAVMTILAKIAEKGKLVIIVTHSERIAAACSRVVRMEDGVIVSDERRRHNKAQPLKARSVPPGNMRLREILRLSRRNLLQNRGRNLLVAAGMSIGIAAIVLILALSGGLTAYVNDVYAGTDSLEMEVSKSDNDYFLWADYTRIDSIEGIDSYIEALFAAGAGITANGASQSINYLYELDEGYLPSLLFGTYPLTGEILVGQALADELSDSYAALIGWTAVVSYGDNTVELTVSGIYEDTSDSSNRYKAFMARDDFLALTGVVEDSAANILYITAEDAGSVAAVINDLTAFGYTVEQQDSVINTILEYIDLGTGVLTAVGGISMLISAIMIFIVLYISVVERTKEIGILRAIGGRKKDVRTMFLAEAGMLGLTAGLLGAFLCLVISIVANIVCLSVLSHAVISYNPLYYLAGLAIAVIISMLSGIAPAVRATDLDPVEALRCD